VKGYCIDKKKKKKQNGIRKVDVNDVFRLLAMIVVFVIHAYTEMNLDTKTKTKKRQI
jgi:hypothetical protein